MLGLLLSIFRNVKFSQEVARLKGQKVLRSLFEGVFEIVIVILLVKLCLLITLIKYLKGHKSLVLLKIITCMCKLVSPFTSQFFVPIEQLFQFGVSETNELFAPLRHTEIVHFGLDSGWTYSTF